MTETSTGSNIIDCPVTGCTWTYKSSLSQEQSILEIIQIHVKLEHSPQVTASAATSKPTKINPPTIDIGVDQEEWNTFKVRWKQYCNAVNLSSQMESLQLFNCASEHLGNLMLQANKDITDEPVNRVMATMEAFAVIRVAKGVTRGELMRMTQGSDESIRTFAARVQGKAETCGFVTTSKCKCGVEQQVYYTEEVIKDVVLAGIADAEIQTSVLDTEGVEEKSINEIVSLIERKERSRKAYRPLAVSAVSAFKRQQTQPLPIVKQDAPPNQSSIIPCPGCNKGFRRFTGKNHKPYKQCRDCFVSRRTRGTKSRSAVNASAIHDSCDTLSQEPSVSTITMIDSLNSASDEEVPAVNGALFKTRLRSHPQVSLRH